LAPVLRQEAVHQFQLAEAAAAYHIAQVAERRRARRVVADHQDAARLRHQPLQLARLFGGGDHRLLHEHVAAGRQGLPAMREVRRVRGRDHHRVQLRLAIHVCRIVVRGRRWRARQFLPQMLGDPILDESRVDIAQRRQLGVLDGVARQVLAEVAAAHQRK
jgi:hypothetical protein